MYARSTQPKKEPECSMEYESNLDDGIKTHCIYAAVVDAGQIDTDQTCRFPVISSRENVSIMVLYEYDGNAIKAEPIKNTKAKELLRSFQVMEQKLASRGLKPKLMTLDNEASKSLKDYMHLPRHKLSASNSVLPPKQCSRTRNSLVQRSFDSRIMLHR
jgi:hypothetical protein